MQKDVISETVTMNKIKCENDAQFNNVVHTVKVDETTDHVNVGLSQTDQISHGKNNVSMSNSSHMTSNGNINVTQSNVVQAPSYNHVANVHQFYAQVSPPAAHTKRPVLEHTAKQTTQELNPLAGTFQPTSPSMNIPQVSEVQQQIRDITKAICLPMMEIPKFKGDPTEFNNFILAFDTRITPRTSCESDKLYYLQQHLEGEARELTSGCMYLNPRDGYSAARQLLSQEYGDPHKISTAFLNSVLNWKPIHNDDALTLRKFSFFLIKCLNAMSQIANLGVLNHLPNLQAIISKLPAYLQNKWRDHASHLRTHEHRTAQFSDIVCFLQRAAEAANDPVFNRQALGQINQNSSTPTNNQGKRNTTTINTSSQNQTQNSKVSSESV